MQKTVWIILNPNFSLTLDGEILNNKVTDKKFSVGSDLWTNELPELKFSNKKLQKDYDNFIKDIIIFFSENRSNEVFINAKLGEESEYDNNLITNHLIIRKIEEYDVDEIIK